MKTPEHLIQKKNTKRKHLDSGISNYQLRHSNVYIVCPHCQNCAIRIYELKRISCLHCGFVRSYEGINWLNEADIYPLWLQTRVRGHSLWAYNEEHLTMLESYISADLRTRTYPVSSDGWSNQSAVSRLPRWMTARHNRKPVLKALAALRQSLPGS